MKKIFFTLTLLISTMSWIFGQDEQIPTLEINGNLLSDQRFLLKKTNPWAWNENRLTIQFNKTITDNSKFYSEIWLRNIGIPSFNNTSALFNKGIIDPYNLEIREAYVQISGFLSKKLDLTIGRQRIAWGTADKINPTDNLNPYDFEDVLDFGRHRGSEAIRADYYLSDNFSIEGVFIPLYQTANLPIGMFSDLMNSAITLPEGMNLVNFSDSLIIPRNIFKEQMTAGIKLKAFVAGIDFSLSYIYGTENMPSASVVDITPIDAFGNVNVHSILVYPRENILGLDFSTNIAGIGFWGEAAAFMATKDVVMTTKFHTVNPYTFQAMTITNDSILLEKNKPYFKFALGIDYSFGNGIYTNLQYIHGFVHESGNANLNDYFFLHVDKSFFNDKLKISPLTGAFIVSDFSDLKNNYSFVYMPEITYNATDNAQITIATAIIDGKGNNMFTGLKDMDMFILKMKYSF